MSQYVDLEAAEVDEADSDSELSSAISGPSSGTTTASGQPKAKRGRKAGSGNKKSPNATSGNSEPPLVRYSVGDSGPVLDAGASGKDDGFEFSFNMQDSAAASITPKFELGSAKTEQGKFIDC